MTSIMTDNSRVVIKLGGSLMDCASSLIRKINKITCQDSQSVLIIPGGAVFADDVRSFQEISGISGDAAHWMAILAMEQYAYYLSDISCVPLTNDLEIHEPGVNVLLPYTILRQDDSGLEHSWDVTSDTISAWVAQRTGSMLVKATDVDGIYLDGKLVRQIYAGDLAGRKETCVDKGLSAFLMKHGMDCMVINGRYFDRVIEALKGGVTGGTLIYGKNKF
ncbi:MAG: 5-(aminomethyl)-3-furanmethanol phosphate kinase [ANME-2 cluster archaeon]|nr:5-(aminomethyl)-3-furanmethanol phosphate kinase [ANME-2 cluster archaeon]